MEAIVEFLIEVLGELLLGLFFESASEIGLRKLKGKPAVGARPAATTNPIRAVIAYLVLGAVVGAISLWLVPHHLIESHAGRIINLAITPVAAGGLMVLLGRWRRRRDQSVILLDRFGYGVVFAFSMALVRFTFGQ
jgi:hypothetical protein